MYCSECGQQAAGKFCCHCGTRLQSAVEPSFDATFDWRTSCDYDRIVAVPEVRNRVERARAEAGRRVSSSQWLQLIDTAASPLTGGFSSVALAKIAQPLSAKLGLKTGKERRELVSLPPGEVLANLAVSLATVEHTLTGTTHSTDACTIEATLPADLRSMEAKLSIEVTRAQQGALVAAAAMVEGAWYDWGKCQKGLNRLFDQMRAA